MHEMHQMLKSLGSPHESMWLVSALHDIVIAGDVSCGVCVAATCCIRGW